MLGGIGVLVIGIAGGVSMMLGHERHGGVSRKQFIDYQARAAQGDVHAQFNLGSCYTEGWPVGRDYAGAVKWYREAADQNYALAQNSLGLCYAKGQGVARDEVEAVKWFRKAADQNLPSAQDNLGECYAKGEGVAKDEIEAVKWFQTAAEQIYVPAQIHLGWAYEYGQGVARDYPTAYAWYSLCSKTDENAARNRVRVEKQMSPQQIDAGKKRAEELRAQIAAKLKSGGK